MALFIFLLVTGWTVIALAEDDIHFWVDANGVRHYSDYFSVPQKPENKPAPLAAGLPDSPGDQAGERAPDSASFTNQLGMDFVLVEKGEFLMGSPKEEIGRDKEEYQHKVLLIRDFYMQTTEVTQGQWKAVMDGQEPAWFSGCDTCPVEYVSYTDVLEFIQKLNAMQSDSQYRLPTEAEWEYACRAGAGTRFAFGDCLGENANYDGTFPSIGCDPGKYPERTAPVSRYPANAWGLYDMHGNVWEWCSDWFAPYPEEFKIKNPAGPPEGLEKVCRGGAWLNEEKLCRSAYRSKRTVSNRSNSVGFRLCLDKGSPGLWTPDPEANPE